MLMKWPTDRKSPVKNQISIHPAAEIVNHLHPRINSSVKFV